jgi:hypothetical protein
MKPVYFVGLVLFLVFVNLIALISAVKGGPHFQRSIAIIVFSIVFVAAFGLYLFQQKFRR